MKTIKSLFYILLFTVVAVSCSDDDPTVFTGDVTVNLLTNDGVQVVEGEAKEFTFNVVLSHSFDRAINLTFELENLAQYPNVLAIETSPVVIASGKTTGTLKVVAKAKPDAENILTENVSFKINLASYTGIENTITLENEQKITVTAEEGFTPLTQAQRELVEYYKTQGINVSPWIGKIPVEVEVTTAADGGFEPFVTAQTLKYSGTTYITLSEKATKEKPLLVMVNNAFGLSEYLQYIFRHETILNTDYWNNTGQPAPTAVLTALGTDKVNKWKNKEYTFNVKVDDLEFKADNTVEFVRENGAYDTYSDFLPDGEKYPTSAVNFVYEFELWNELATLAKDNAELTEHIKSGGSIHPNNYITTGGILTDAWETGNWVAPTSSYKNTEMTFTFNTDHRNSGDYDKVTVKYTPASN